MTDGAIFKRSWRFSQNSRQRAAARFWAAASTFEGIEMNAAFRRLSVSRFLIASLLSALSGCRLLVV